MANDIHMDPLMYTDVRFRERKPMKFPRVTKDTRGKKISVKINYKYGWACKKYRNKAGMKYKKTILLWRKNLGKQHTQYTTTYTILSLQN